ncbi:MAG: ATP-binding cassette domain-containing protein [bacterium]|nr:ATP-binding cassette domain-containing protein [bacterium]
MSKDNEPLLQVINLKKHFPIVKGFFNKVVGQVKAVDGVSFDLFSGECLGLVGESGSGKTTVGRTILRALSPTEGRVLFRLGEETIDVATASAGVLKNLRQHMQMIFQDPYASLNPRMTVLDLIGEPLLVNGMTDRTEREERVQKLLVQVGLKPHFLRRYPHAFSGGQRQRIGIARALALHPKLVVCDEPVSALDVSVQAQALNLLQELQEEFGLTYLFVAHDLSVVRHISDRVAVMYVGKIVELSPVDELFERPLHPYTEALLSAVPVPDPRRKKKRLLLSGEVADPSHAPSGCAFHPRCAYVKDQCRSEIPELREIGPGHFARCHFSDILQLQGQADL